MKNPSHYSVLSRMFRYPSVDLRNHIDEWRKIVSEYDPGLSEYLDPFISHIENETLESQQEYFTRTFYVQPLCCLDIGYVLFGEDYRRGQFMANLKTEHRLAGNDCGTELPDHLPSLMELLPKLTDQAFAEELIISLIVPALHEMIAEFRSDNNYYKSLLRIIVAIMEKDFPESGYERFRFIRRNMQKKIPTE